MNIPEYVARMYELQHTSADDWREFEQGGFTVSTNPISFTAIGVEQAQEHVNKIHKGHGGMSGITNSPEALLRYCLSTPELTRISRETEQMLGMTQAVQTHHHNLCKANVVRQEKYIKQLKDILSPANPFKVPESTDGTEKKLVHLTNNIIMPQNVQDSILDTEIRGHTAYASFVDDRISGDKNLWDKMTKVKLLSWTSGAKVIKAKVGSEEISLKASTSLMARLLVITRSSREIDIKEVIGTFEFSTTNRMLMTPDGRIHPCTDKATLIHELEKQVEMDDHQTATNPSEQNEQISDHIDGPPDLPPDVHFDENIPENIKMYLSIL